MTDPVVAFVFGGVMCTGRGRGPIARRASPESGRGALRFGSCDTSNRRLRRPRSVRGHRRDNPVARRGTAVRDRIGAPGRRHPRAARRRRRRCRFLRRPLPTQDVAGGYRRRHPRIRRPGLGLGGRQPDAGAAVAGHRVTVRPADGRLLRTSDAHRARMDVGCTVDRITGGVHAARATHRGIDDPPFGDWIIPLA